MEWNLVAETLETETFQHLAPPLQVAILLGALSFIVSLLVSVTAFTRIIIVLSFVRRALTTQEIPPNPVIMGLALFLTLFVMAPTFQAIHTNAVKPYLADQGDEEKAIEEKVSLEEAFNIACDELKVFMLHNTRETDLLLFMDMAKRSEQPVAASPGAEPLDEAELTYEEYKQVPLTTLVPAFIISELKTAFIMGFCIYIPFLLIDLVVSTVLMSLGMMMMPPVVVATPCKLLLFVMVDGWQLIAQALVTSFGG
ncbi:MAG: flagellar type III secretion system pore protein FliP [Pirellulaceae bacterium]